MNAELAQATLSNLSHMTNPHTAWPQSGEVVAATSSIHSQRQVTEALPPLTADSYDWSSGEPGAVPDDRPLFVYNQVRELVAA